MQQELREIEEKLGQSGGERERYDLLAGICASLERLEALDAGQLFWGEDAAHGATVIERAQQQVAAFHRRIGATEENKQALEQAIHGELWKLDGLQFELAELQEREQRRLDEFVVEREITPLPYRPTVMPWSKQGEDERRFRKALLASLLVSLVFGLTTHYWTLPQPDPSQVVEVPERLARLVKQPEPPPPPPPREEERKPEPEREVEREQAVAQPEPPPSPAERQEARRTAESAGVLAFKNSFADLIENAPEARLGVDARVSDAGQKAQGGQTQRAIVTSAARTGSGGIDTAALSRDVGGTRGGMEGVAFSRVDSAIGTGTGDAGERPLSDGPGPSRTDEEIQIVFDRYQATLYRIYNVALRQNPTLQGRIVLRITIEPDGEVSMARVDSTDLASQDLVDQILDRVRRFNFGPKEGVPTVTIVFPIDLLPAR
ncbi:AgmX/PglI C-terminal domain-containing protein [Ectothiorhodospiraceae bacterium 2226]|nr:AgmX/PglI C-terminal domain-containing protein [Ectothiorhodospiraceae bacterium 2226]